MSLFTHDEVCENCKHSQWIDGDQFWDGRPRFTKCKVNSESRVNSSDGTCIEKELTEGQDNDK